MDVCKHLDTNNNCIHIQMQYLKKKLLCFINQKAKSVHSIHPSRDEVHTWWGITQKKKKKRKKIFKKAKKLTLPGHGQGSARLWRRNLLTLKLWHCHWRDPMRCPAQDLCVHLPVDDPGVYAQPTRETEFVNYIPRRKMDFPITLKARKKWVLVFGFFIILKLVE